MNIDMILQTIYPASKRLESQDYKVLVNPGSVLLLPAQYSHTSLPQQSDPPVRPLSIQLESPVQSLAQNVESPTWRDSVLEMFDRPQYWDQDEVLGHTVIIISIHVKSIKIKLNMKSSSSSISWDGLLPLCLWKEWIIRRVEGLPCSGKSYQLQRRESPQSFIYLSLITLISLHDEWK